jgi:hypothetical protein
MHTLYEYTMCVVRTRCTTIIIVISYNFISKTVFMYRGKNVTRKIIPLFVRLLLVGWSKILVFESKISNQDATAASYNTIPPSNRAYIMCKRILYTMNFYCKLDLFP